MTEATPPPSAAQVFDAALRAEAEGRFDYATQCYRHLSDNHGEAPEAIAARVALTRLAQGRPASPSPRRPPELPAVRPIGDVAASSASAGRIAPQRPPIRIAPAGNSDMRRAPEFPDPVRGYVAGRIIAYATSAGGLLVALLALALSVAQAMASEVLLNVVGSDSPLLNPLAGPVAIASGLAAFFIGQLALALFGCANATRELVAFERAKAEHASQYYR